MGWSGARTWSRGTGCDPVRRLLRQRQIPRVRRQTKDEVFFFRSAAVRYGISALEESRATGIAHPALGLVGSQILSAYLVTRKRKALKRKPPDPSEPNRQASMMRLTMTLR